MSRRGKKNSDGEEKRSKKSNNLEIEYLSPIRIEKEFEKHSIDRQKLEIIQEFSISLINICHNTYFGNEYMNTFEKVKQHFDWCFTTINQKFNQIGFDFKKTKDVYNYFFTHINTHMYNNKAYNEETDLFLDLQYFKTITNYFNVKTEDDLILLVQIDLLFKKSMKFC